MLTLPQNTSQPAFPAYWLENAVFGLDRWLRRRLGVFEYTNDPDCIFRIQHIEAKAPQTLAGGALIEPGSPLLDLHLWNEHIPQMGRDGPTIGWARTFSRAIHASLRQLARYLDEHAELDDIAALRADMRLGTEQRGAQPVRLSARFGFEPSADATQPVHRHAGTLHHLGENILIFLLLLATNPAAVGTPVLRRDRKLVYLPRAALERRYGRAWNAGMVVRKRGAPGAC